MPDQSASGSGHCNACGGDKQDHNLCVANEPVLGGDIWVYDDDYARVVPWWTPRDRLGGESA